MTALMDRAKLARVLPFLAFIGLLALRGLLPDGTHAGGIDLRWLYALQAGVAAALLLWCWREYGELAHAPRVADVLLAVAVGLAICWLWVALDEPWMRVGTPSVSFRPIDGEGAPLWGLIAVRWLGAALVVPVMEELFWRSFVMRWLQRHDFHEVDPRTVGLRAVLLSTFVFMLAHTEWLAAVIAGLAYAWLYRRTGSLWPSVIAHAVTNGMLGAWVVLGGHWSYW